MRELDVDLAEARAMFLEQVDGLLAAVETFSDVELLDPSLCRGWSRLEVVVHVRLGLDEVAATTAAFTDHEADHDAASYWCRSEDSESDPVPGILWLRRVDSATASPSGAVQHFRDAAQRVRLIISQASERTVLFQGKAMTMGNFIATWVAELAIHQADLNIRTPPAHIAFARRTIEAVAGADLPAELSDLDAVLVGLGRKPADDSFGEWGPYPRPPMSWSTGGDLTRSEPGGLHAEEPEPIEDPGHRLLQGPSCGSQPGESLGGHRRAVHGI
ncbi:maleylpyruvate isomerase N-terminal domain-containing protein [Phycicoccus sp. KQZ13P-1]|uniref:maleylpyruvate isomerase N-terminal domain-containing protein n=1 Tax=Phycicoccus mangrovi TaxID=2840470 RepID=UPI001C0032D2|nr:maleylpyruvate isomerase N-terminal domain-containing protein [Phycicoccus mangrovi]MBT9257677.1 maleylpyruvate isomerase N-terminal domain-containing protein [Phycicoccus mangrovi]